MENKIKILILEDALTDLDLMLDELSKAGINYVHFHVENEKDFRKGLVDFNPDLILSDYMLPQFNGMEALMIAKKISPLIPFIIVTGTINEETAVECMKAGATDYVIKEHLARLASAVKVALENKELMLANKIAAESLKQSEKKFRSLIDSANDAFIISDSKGDIIMWNKGAKDIFGYTSDEIINQSVSVLMPEAYRDKHNQGLSNFNNTQIPALIGTTVEVEGLKKDGTTFPISISLSHWKADSEFYYGAIIRDITDSKRAEETIKISEKKYRKLFNDNLAGNFISAVDGTILLCNPALAKIFGFDSPEELINENITSFYKANSNRENLLNLLHEQNKIEQVEQNFILRDGREISVIESVEGEFNQDGELVCLKGYLIDNTQRKLAEDELRSSKLAIEEIIKAVPARVFWKDRNLIYLGCNAEFAKDAGLADPKQIIGKDDYQMVWRDQAELYRADDRYVMDSDSPNLMIEEHQTTPDGKTINLLTSKIPLRNSEGKIIGVLGTYMDITERKKAEEKNLKLSKAVEHSPVSIVITDNKGNIEYVNPMFTELTGYRFEEVIGKNTNILKSGYHTKEFYENLWAKILAGKDFTAEMYNKKKNGELFWENANISPITNRNGDITHFVAVKEDITEKKKNIEDLIIAKEKAEESNLIKSNFLSSISHELRTPLVGILGYTEMLRQELDDKEHLEMLENIMFSGNRLRTTLTNLLDLTSFETGEYEILTKLTNLKNVVEDELSLFQKVITAKNLYLNFECPDNLSEYIDEKIFRNVLNHLVNNAIAFTTDGGILVKLFKTDLDGKPFIITSIHDTGIGIDQKDHQTIFESFRQVSEGLSRNYEGTGLGLTLSIKMLELVQGTISVESVPGKGSIFTFRIPIAPKNETGPSVIPENIITSDVTDTTDGQNSKLLLVEDDALNRRVIKRLLSNQYQVDLANNSISAIEQVKQNNYSVIIMDINLGLGKNGIETAEEIRKLENYKNIPIIAVTAYANPGDEENILSSGINYYLSKPFSLKQLTGLIQKAMAYNKLIDAN